MAAELEFDAGIHLGAAVGDKLDSIRDLLDRKDPRPSYIPLSGAFQAPATSGTIQLGHPPANKIWNVLSIVAFGADDHTAVAGGNVAWYTTSDTSQLSLFGLRDTGIAIPSQRNYSRDIMWCYPNEHIVVSAVATGATVIGVNMVVAEWNIRDKW